MEKRTAHKSKISYEDTWDDALKIMEKDMSNKKRDLAAILDNLLRQKVHERFEKRFSRDLHKKIGITIKRDLPPEKRLVVQNGLYSIVPFDTILDYNLIDILATHIQQKENQIDYVVELGSGIGINLFLIAYKLDPDLRKRIRYFSCEVTDSGRTACEKLIRFSGELKMSAEHFDYYHPDFSFLEPQKNILFFTAHSIEQIPKIDKALFEAMIGVSNQCNCYHAEPVGWQYDENVTNQRARLKPNHWKRNRSKVRRKIEKIDRWLFSRYGVGIVDKSHRFGINVEKTDIGKPGKVSINAALHSFAKDYNTNLVSTLKKMENDSLISIDTEMVNLYGKNPFNPTSIISWHKIVE
ncbi:MAG: hypothetical protein B6I22_13500 [Desulfobacteraceae bacterium 4572_123]|nr:MAG: hypothetical protein B6I22_13500 [Desulfobacteraceae bacterium 4572_123]